MFFRAGNYADRCVCFLRKPKVDWLFTCGSLVGHQRADPIEATKPTIREIKRYQKKHVNLVPPNLGFWYRPFRPEVDIESFGVLVVQARLE